jgi:hypothetical protein
MVSWLTSAAEAGLDEDGVVALFTSVMRDFFKSRGDAAGQSGDGETEGVA